MRDWMVTEMHHFLFCYQSRFTDKTMALLQQAALIRGYAFLDEGKEENVKIVGYSISH